MADIHLAAIKMDRSDQPIFVAADVEDDPLIYFVGGWKCGAEFDKISELRGCHHLEPTCQRCLTVWMSFPKQSQGFAGDDAHGESVSQNEILGNLKSDVARDKNRVAFPVISITISPFQISKEVR